MELHVSPEEAAAGAVALSRLIQQEEQIMPQQKQCFISVDPAPGPLTKEHYAVFWWGTQAPTVLDGVFSPASRDECPDMLAIDLVYLREAFGLDIKPGQCLRVQCSIQVLEQITAPTEGPRTDDK